MAKHRKTLQQKKIADLRHKFYSFNNIRAGFDSVKLSSDSKNVPSDSISVTTISKYPYLLHDLLKTGILTLSIIAIQLILFVLLKNHILVLPMVKY